MKSGNCHICGKFGKLSFEHVPPESAFNNQKVITPDIRKVLTLSNLDDIESLRGKQSQKGQGGYTLCEPCNNKTGEWYGSNYAAWVHQGADYLRRSKGGLNLSYPYHILPLRVIKQIACMFFSANSPRFRQAQPELEKFVLDRETKYLPPTIRIYVGYLHSDRNRSAGVTGSIKIDETTGTACNRIYSEISFPPYSYILSLDSPPPEHYMLDISFFAKFGYNEFTTLQLPIPLLSIYTAFPGDFRNRETVLREANL